MENKIRFRDVNIILIISDVKQATDGNFEEKKIISSAKDQNTQKRII